MCIEYRKEMKMYNLYYFCDLIELLIKDLEFRIYMLIFYVIVCICIKYRRQMYTCINVCILMFFEYYLFTILNAIFSHLIELFFELPF